MYYPNKLEANKHHKITLAKNNYISDSDITFLLYS